MRKILMLAAVLGALAFVPAHADNWCPSGYPGGETDVIVFSGNAVGLNAGIVGCTATDGSSDPIYNTDYITPGSGEISARWLQATQPTAGALSAIGVVITDCAGGTQSGNSCSLNWTADDPANPTMWDSQWMSIDPQSTLAGGSFTATVDYVGDEGAASQSHTYRTVS